VRIRATAKGLRALARGRAMRIETLERLVRGLRAADRVALERAVGIVEAMLGQRPAPRS
jgi:hypothetical protein